ncbi:MAG: sialidase family protein [Planctomycetota bacterium]|jgi:hypothetical protein
MVFSLRHAQLLAISVTTLVACSVNPTDPREAEPHIPLPRPSGFEEGEDSQAEREAWIESMHSAAPGFDWRAEEQKNKLDAMARRETALMSRAPSDGSWNEVGSNNLAGSTFVAVQSTDGQELYVGSAHGGVFRGPKDGSDWVAIGDGVYGGAHHLLTIPPAGGGQDIVLRAVNGAMWRSLDNGTTWQAPTGLTGMSTIHRLLKLDDSQQTILMVAWQSGWKLFRSVDRGASFTVARDLAGDSDIFTPRTGLGSVYLFEQDRMYESTDAGVTFQAFGNPLGFHPTDVKLGGHEASGNTTFSLAANDGGWELWRTTDSANSWSFASDMPEMWSAFCTSATDEDLLVYGGVELWVSRDGGNSFSVQNWWWEHPGDRYGKLHADIMGVSVVEDAALSSGERWYINTHGGTCESVDQLATTDWLSYDGMGVSQYYSTHTSRRNPEYMHAGSQDQGYQTSVLGTPGSSGPWADFTEIITGDYGHLSSSDGSHDLVYSDYPGFVLVTAHAPNPTLYYPDFPTGFEGQWLPFLVADPELAPVFYLCGKTIWRYERVGFTGTWNYAPLHPSAFGQPVTALGFSPIDPNFATCITDPGRIYTSQNRGANWTFITSGGPGAHYFYGTSIVHSSTDLDTVWIAGSGYTNPPVMATFDGGSTWLDMSDGLPNTLVYDICEAVDGSGRMYAASENGAWEYDPATQTWSDILGGEGPLTTYWSVESVPSQNIIRFGTYGRGAWDYYPETPGFFPYGELRGSPNTLEMKASAQPLLGDLITITVTGAEPGASGFFAVSAAEDDYVVFGGDVLIDSSQIIYRTDLTADGSGTATTQLSIPNNPALIGVERYLQAGIQDSSMTFGWAFSHGLRALIGQ